MFLLLRGCCFIQSLHFSYELQEDSVQNSNQSVQLPCIHLDDVVFRPYAHQSATSVQTMRTFHPDAHQCLETSTVQDCIRSDVMANRPASTQSSRRIQRSSASVRTTWQYRLDAIQCSISNRVSISDTVMGRELLPSGRCVFPSGRYP